MVEDPDPPPPEDKELPPDEPVPDELAPDEPPPEHAESIKTVIANKALIPTAAEADRLFLLCTRIS